MEAAPYGFFGDALEIVGSGHVTITNNYVSLHKFFSHPHSRSFLL
jgi:hypothetical protein